MQKRCYAMSTEEEDAGREDGTENEGTADAKQKLRGACCLAVVRLLVKLFQSVNIWNCIYV